MKYDYIGFLKDCFEEAENQKMVNNSFYWENLKIMLGNPYINSSIEKLLKKRKQLT